MEKRGLSTVVETLILVLLSMVAIAVIWIVVSGLISKQSQVAKAQSEFFAETVEFTKVQINAMNGLQLNVNVKTTSGTWKEETSNITQSPPEVDVVSVADLSASMRECSPTTQACCTNIKGYGWNANLCSGIPSANLSKCQSQCGGTLLDSLTSVQNANNQLLGTIFGAPGNNNRVGLVAYNTSYIPKFSANLTNNQANLTSIMNSWESWGSTCICCGIGNASLKLAGSNKLKTIVLMSDGIANQRCNTGTGNATQDAINAACSVYSQLQNLTIYTVSLGPDADQATMAAIAQCGHGENFTAASVDELIQLYQSIADKIIKQYTTTHKFSYMRIVFYDNFSHSVIQNADVPGPLETKMYQFDLAGTGLIAPIMKIELYPVITTTDGKEVIGPLFSSWERKY